MQPLFAMHLIVREHETLGRLREAVTMMQPTACHLIDQFPGIAKQEYIDHGKTYTFLKKRRADPTFPVRYYDQVIAVLARQVCKTNDYDGNLLISLNNLRGLINF